MMPVISFFRILKRGGYMVRVVGGEYDIARCPNCGYTCSVEEAESLAWLCPRCPNGVLERRLGDTWMTDE